MRKYLNDGASNLAWWRVQQQIECCRATLEGIPFSRVRCVLAMQRAFSF